MRTYQVFYQSITLPPWAPPPWLFGVAWSIIYPLFIGATVYLVYLTVKRRVPPYVIVVVAVNWASNILFTPVQLGLAPLWPASLDILVVLGTLAYVERWAWRRSRLVFWLLVPYLLWGIFATALQLTITATNHASPVVTPLADAMIIVDQPLPGGNVHSPLVVSGRARGTWFFEASFPVILTDWDGLIIAQTAARAQSDWMTGDFVPFEATLTFTEPVSPVSSRGFLILKKDNPSGLPANDDSREITVFFTNP